jgi:hypothetical protein
MNENLNVTVKLSLNESQHRRLAITLAGIEQDVRHTLRLANAPPADGLLTHYHDRLPPRVRPSLTEAAVRIDQQLRKLTRGLELQPGHESVRRSLMAALLLDEIAIEEVLPGRLRGYGEIAPATAEYLQRELGELRGLVKQLTESVRLT